MSDVALYRKYRPETFKDVAGQDHVVSVLEGAIKNDNVAHAYMFSGSRGIGKTSIARIFAKVLGTGESDLYEIDAASNRGIDEIRELREAVHTRPFDSKYKVYIVDEVHMLTTPAFNALLKTLEEPPAHVIFILATTELHKVPDTIISRCQSFDFKRPSESEIKKVIEGVAKKEGYAIPKESLTLMAQLSEGSLRDALGVLQKVVSVSKDKKIDEDEIQRITGAPTSTNIHEFLSALLDGDLDAGLAIVAKLSEQGTDMAVFTKLSMHKLRFAMLISYSADMKKKLTEEVSKDEFALLESYGTKKNARLMSAFLKELIDAYEALNSAYIKTLPLEIMLVNMLGKKEE